MDQEINSRPESGEHPAERVVPGHAVLQRDEPAKPRPLAADKSLDVGPALGAAQGHEDHFQQVVVLATIYTGIGNI
jgi:hypothetical protein